MKLKNLMTGGLLAVSATFLASTAANASQSAQYHDGDVLLGFYSNNNTDDYVIDLGALNPDSSFTLLNTVSGIGTDLATAFGANWYANSVSGSDLIYYAVIQTVTATGNLEITNPDPGDGPWTSSPGSGPYSSAVTSIGNFISQQPNTGQASDGLIQLKSATASWYYYAAFNGGANGGEGALDGGFENPDALGDYGISDVVQNSLEFDEVYNSFSPSVVLGTYSLDSAGDVTYTAAVPEPSTFAAIGLGAAVLAFARRRRVA